MTNNKSLEGKVIAVLGASSGIGEGITQAIDTYSPKGIVLAARRENLLQGIASGLSSDTLVVPTDATSEESIQNLIEKTIEKYGHLDVMINSAGVIQEETLLEHMEANALDTILHTNLHSVIHVGRYIAPVFKKQENGVYLVISSQAGKYAFAGEVAYNASKAGADHAIRALDLEFRPHREKEKPLYAFSVGPGFIDTPEARKKFPDVSAETWEKAPKPLDFGHTIAQYVLDPLANYERGVREKKDGAVHHIETVRV